MSSIVLAHGDSQEQAVRNVSKVITEKEMNASNVVAIDMNASLMMSLVPSLFANARLI